MSLPTPTPTPVMTPQRRDRLHELSISVSTAVTVWTVLLVGLIQWRGSARSWEPAMLYLAPVLLVASAVTFVLTRRPHDSP